MHIPKGPTAGLELALFEPALQAALQPSRIMMRPAGCMCPIPTPSTVTFWAPAAKSR